MPIYKYACCSCLPDASIEQKGAFVWSKLTLGQRMMGTTPRVTRTEKRPSTRASDADCTAPAKTTSIAAASKLSQIARAGAFLLMEIVGMSAQNAMGSCIKEELSGHEFIPHASTSM